MTVIKTIIRDRHIDVPAPDELPDGTEVVVTIGPSVADEEPMSPQEIERVLAAMRQLEPLEIPSEISADLDAWERKLDQFGIDNADKGIEEVFR